MQKKKYIWYILRNIRWMESIYIIGEGGGNSFFLLLVFKPNERKCKRATHFFFYYFLQWNSMIFCFAFLSQETNILAKMTLVIEREKNFTYSTWIFFYLLTLLICTYVCVCVCVFMLYVCSFSFFQIVNIYKSICNKIH